MDEQQKQVGVRQLYNQVPQKAWGSWSWSQLETRCPCENQRQTEGFRPSVTNGWATKPRWERSAAMVRRTLGQNNSLSPSPAHLSHTTNINPFENKVWERYFYKEVCSFVHWSRQYCWLCFCLYLYLHCVVVCGYTTLVSHQIFDDRPLFSPGTLWYAVILNRLKTNSFARLK